MAASRSASTRPNSGRRFDARSLPGWADFNGGDVYYGFPDLEGRGFKIAHDAHGPAMDPDEGDRTPADETLARVRAFSKHGPAVGRYATQLLAGTLTRREERFSLASKGRRAAREVH